MGKATDSDFLGRDLCVSPRAISSDLYRRGGGGDGASGAGLEIFWGVASSPFGEALLLAAEGGEKGEGGVLGLAFGSSEGEARGRILDEMRSSLPRAVYREEPGVVAPFMAEIFGGSGGASVGLILLGTAFQLRVWRGLLEIPVGRTTDYASLAERIGAGVSSARAVGLAVGRNPVSYVVPCHRVLRRDGGLGGYRWGMDRKRAMLACEGSL